MSYVIGIVNDCRLENPYVDEPGCIMVNSIKGEGMLDVL